MSNSKVPFIVLIGDDPNKIQDIAKLRREIFDRGTKGPVEDLDPNNIILLAKENALDIEHHTRPQLWGNPTADQAREYARALDEYNSSKYLTLAQIVEEHNEGILNSAKNLLRIGSGILGAGLTVKQYSVLLTLVEERHGKNLPAYYQTYRDSAGIFRGVYPD